MRLKLVSKPAVAVALVVLASCIVATFLHTTTAAAKTSAADIKPPIVKKYIAFGAARKAQMADYSKRHYHQHTAKLNKPKVIVLHHTGGSTWQSAWWTFENNTAYNDELPGVVAHFIIGKDGTIYQCLPLNLRGRHAIGMNWTAIGIEFVQEPRDGKDAHWMDKQILARKRQVRAGLRLVRYLRLRFEIERANVIGHAMADGSPHFLDYTGARNHAGDWHKAETKRFRSRL